MGVGAVSEDVDTAPLASLGLLRPEEAAARLDISLGTLNKWINEGRLTVQRGRGTKGWRWLHEREVEYLADLRAEQKLCRDRGAYIERLEAILAGVRAAASVR